MGKILPTLIGSFFGFILGLLSLYLKEFIDYKKREAFFVVNMIYFSKNLKQYLHENPENIVEFDIKIIVSYIDIGVYNDKYTKMFQFLFSVYMDWRRGFYMPGRAKCDDLFKIKSEIENFVINLELKPPQRGYFRVK